MENYFTNIHINKVFHLAQFDIQLGSKQHVFITGKNGSGKTSLLNAIVDHLQKIMNDKSLSHKKFDNFIIHFTNREVNSADPIEIENAKSDKIRYEKQKESFFGKVRIDFTDIFQTIKDFNNGDFIVAYYKALRVPSFEEVKVLEKPKLSISTNIQESSTNQFLKFLVDYKIQAALARNEGNFDDDDHIKKWFDEFKDCLRSIFDDSNLDLIFDYHKYSFSIQSLGKVFKFTELSAGYAAALDIVSDLMLKMQKKVH